VHVPPSYNPAVPMPVVMLLHGYGGTGASIEADVGLTPLADSFGFLYLHPDGMTDFLGNGYWNATDACCDLFNTGVDDSAYLRALLDTVRGLFNVDDRRIHVMGASNGGFMTHRMACDHADLIASIADIAGATWNNPVFCGATEPVSVLHVHGTADTTILYPGGIIAAAYPGAVETTEQWAAVGGCSLVPDTSLPNLDLEATIPGAETTVTRYVSGCAPGIEAQLWTIVGGGHIPTPTAVFAPMMIQFLFDHPKPVGCVADIAPIGVGNGVVNIDDLVAVLNNFGPCPQMPPLPCFADIAPPGSPGIPAGNGVVNIDDLVAVLNAFGVCP